MRFPTIIVNVVCATSRASDQHAHMRSLIRAFASHLKYSLTLKLLTEHHLEFLNLEGGCAGLSKFTLVHIVGNNVSRLIFLIAFVGHFVEQKCPFQ